MKSSITKKEKTMKKSIVIALMFSAFIATPVFAGQIDVTIERIDIMGPTYATEGIRDTTSGHLITVPSGAIIMWSGATIPGGWALCDGTNGTPNLVDRFILGGDFGATVAHGPGDPSGSVDTLRLSPNQMPQHTHTYEFRINRGGTSGLPFTHNDSHGSATAGTTSSAGGDGNPDLKGAPHGHSISTDIKPKHYALAYIMKL